MILEIMTEMSKHLEQKIKKIIYKTLAKIPKNNGVGTACGVRGGDGGGGGDGVGRGCGRGGRGRGRGGGGPKENGCK